MPTHLYASDPRYPRMDALASLAALLANAAPIHAAEWLATCAPQRRAEFEQELARARAAVSAEMAKEIAA